jgi:hypothetical protein
MYVYLGWLNFKTYAVNEPFALVVETDFSTGAAVRALWTWTVNSGGSKHQPTQCSGTVDRGITDKFNDSYTFGLFYNRYYPFDVTFENNFKYGQVTMYEYPKDDPKCYVAATFSLTLVWTGREKASNYYPARVLPSIQYFQGIYNDRLFAMILPDNLCDNGLIITIFSEDSGNSIWYPQSLMQLKSQTTTKATVGFSAGKYNAVMELNKDNDNWKCDSWSVSSNYGAAMASFKVMDKNQKTQDLDQAFITLRTKPESYGEQISFSPSHLGKIHPPMPSKEPNSFSLADSSDFADSSNFAISSKHAIHMSASSNFRSLDRVTTTIKNDTNDPVLCTLRETTTGVQGKILAGAGMGLALAGLATTYPKLAALSIPAAVIGALLASTGLYDAFKPDKGPVRMLLFPNETMYRTTSAGLPFDDENDLEMFRQDIKNNFLRTLEGKKGSLGASTYNLSTFVQDSSLWTQQDPLALPSDKTFAIKWAKLVKFDSLVPMYSCSATMTKMGDADYYVVKDGQLVLCYNGSAATYSTLNDISSAWKGTDLFKFDSNQKSILRHEYVTGKNYDIIRVPGSRMVVLRIKYCSIVGVGERDKNSLRRVCTNPADESDVWRKIAYDSGYDLYSWTSGWPVFGYKMDKLGSATIQKTSDASNIVYVPATGWRAWREMTVT